MPKTAFVDFRAVKAALTMERVLAHYGLLDKFKRNGDSLSGPCPIHKGSNPTQFRVSLEKNLWNCFSECKHGGNALDFIAKMENVAIHAAALKAVEWFQIDASADSAESHEEPEGEPRPKPVPKKAPAPENSAPNPPLKFRLDKLERSHPYLLEKRGLTRETIINFGIGLCAKGVMADRIAIPIHNDKGEVVAYAGRFPGDPPEDTPKYKLPPGFRKSQELFNLDRAAKEPREREWIVVEGFFDCMRLHQHGWRKVVALMGSTLSQPQEELLKKHVTPQSKVIILLDGNEAGQAGQEDIASRLSKVCFVRAHRLPPPDMEPEHLTAEGIAEIVGGAK